jgi:coproporphyrinogen III oxidase
LFINDMPDPAIEAHKAGLDYTQPTGKGIKKAKVSYEWVSDPSNPLAPPRQRRVIEAGNGGSGGIFSKWFGGGEKITPIPVSPISVIMLSSN